MGYAVVHFGAGGADDESLVAFYRELFRWNFDCGGGGFTMIDTGGGGGINGSIRKGQHGEPSPAFYVDAEDPQATLDRAISLGGKVAMPVTGFGTVTVAMFEDLDGLLVGLVKARDEMVPSKGEGEAVDWFEILGSDAARTQQFYADLFGWKVDSSGFPGYAVVDTGTGRGIWGGIGGGQQSRWAMVYAGVPDVEQILSRAEELGGSRIVDPGVTALKNAARAALYGSAEDISTGVFRDPAGNVFGVYHKETR